MTVQTDNHNHNQEHERIKTMANEMVNEMSGGAILGLPFTYIIQLLLSILASYLNWNCLANQSTPIRVITTVMSFFFAIYYLVFYLVFKIILGKTC